MPIADPLGNMIEDESVNDGDGFGEDIYKLNQEDPEYLKGHGLAGQTLSDDLIQMNEDAMSEKKQIAISYQFVPENRSVFGGFCPSTAMSCQKNGAIGYTVEEERERPPMQFVPQPPQTQPAMHQGGLIQLCQFINDHYNFE